MKQRDENSISAELADIFEAWTAAGFDPRTACTMLGVSLETFDECMRLDRYGFRERIEWASGEALRAKEAGRPALIYMDGASQKSASAALDVEDLPKPAGPKRAKVKLLPSHRRTARGPSSALTENASARGLAEAILHLNRAGLLASIVDALALSNEERARWREALSAIQSAI